MSPTGMPSCCYVFFSMRFVFLVNATHSLKMSTWEIGTVFARILFVLITLHMNESCHSFYFEGS